MGNKRKKKPIVVHGKDLTAYGVFRLGQTYRMHADALASVVSQFGPQMSDHPRRLLYFQALENYLRSFQLLGGETPEIVRDYGHDFAKRLKTCKALGLQLPQEVEDKICTDLAIEYVRVRYDYRLDDEIEPWASEETLEQLRSVVEELERSVGLAVQASNPEFIMFGNIKLFKLSASEWAGSAISAR
ncbi:hypothetical protein [Mesorhizobium sp. M0674]|uniref:hypothetical protein n=1 Tax=unclassified Mesorhizobium TaxID=325217 RepID=UPI00333C63FC